MAVQFIPREVVLTVHAHLLQRYGGKPGLRDADALDSALAQPKETFGGRYSHNTLFDKAAVYGLHLCKNRPFVDGNKRVAFVLMDIFLQKNGWELVSPEEETYKMMMNLSSGKMKKPQLSSWLKEHSSKLTRR